MELLISIDSDFAKKLKDLGADIRLASVHTEFGKDNKITWLRKVYALDLNSLETSFIHGYYRGKSLNDILTRIFAEEADRGQWYCIPLDGGQTGAFKHIGWLEG